MTVDQLTRDQVIELKQAYMGELVNEGKFAETFGVEYDEPSWGDLANADELVSDAVVEEHYAGIDFVSDDFFCSCFAVN